MYIVDFAKHLFQRKNAGIIVYLILNTLIVMGLFQDPVTGLILYAVSLVLALSPFGEWVLRVQQGCKPLARKEHKDRLLPLFNEVYQRAKQLDASISDNVKLFICKEQSPNAFATGRKTICVTKGLLQFSDEEIKATLAHEFGHLANKEHGLNLNCGGRQPGCFGHVCFVQDHCVGIRHRYERGEPQPRLAFGNILH